VEREESKDEEGESDEDDEEAEEEKDDENEGGEEEGDRSRFCGREMSRECWLLLGDVVDVERVVMSTEKEEVGVE
jgi:hypothetical protein